MSKEKKELDLWKVGAMAGVVSGVCFSAVCLIATVKFGLLEKEDPRVFIWFALTAVFAVIGALVGRYFDTHAQKESQAGTDTSLQQGSINL